MLKVQSVLVGVMCRVWRDFYILFYYILYIYFIYLFILFIYLFIFFFVCVCVCVYSSVSDYYSFIYGRETFWTAGHLVFPTLNSLPKYLSQPFTGTFVNMTVLLFGLLVDLKFKSSFLSFPSLASSSSSFTSFPFSFCLLPPPSLPFPLPTIGH